MPLYSSKLVLPSVQPEDYVSAADGGDWLNAMLRAQAAGFAIQLSANKTYEMSASIRNVSNRRWLGSGPSTVLRVVPTGNALTRSAFMLGNTHPIFFKYPIDAGLGRAPNYDIAPVKAGDVSTQLATAGNYINFRADQFVYVRTTQEFLTSGVNYPYWAQLCKVRSVTSGGLVEFYDPIKMNIASAALVVFDNVVDPAMAGATGNAAYPWEIVENVEVAYMTVDAKSPFATRTGAYRCHLHDIQCINAAQILSVNAFNKCNVHDITGNFTDRLMEVKHYSFDNDWARIEGRLIGAGMNYQVDIGEMSTDNRLQGIRVAVPPSATTTVAPLCNGGINTIIRDSVFIGASGGGGGAVMELPSGYAVGYAGRGFRLLNSQLVAGPTRHYHGVIGSLGSVGGENPDDYFLDDNTFVGQTVTGYSLWVATGGGKGRLAGRAPTLPTLVGSGGQAPQFTPPAFVPANSLQYFDGVNAREYGLIPAYSRTGQSYDLGGRRLFPANALRVSADGMDIEPAATNLLLQSKFAASAWPNNGHATLTQGITGPDGTTNAVKLFDDAANTIHRVNQSIAVPGGSSITYTYSVLAQDAGCGLALSVTNTGVAYVTQGFVLSGAGSLAAASSNLAGILSSPSGTITKIGNWYLCTLTFTANASVTGLLLIVDTFNGASNVYVGNGTSAVIMSDAQVEVGSKATGRIPTTTAAAARGADVFQFVNVGGHIVWTFDDASTQTDTVATGAYTVPTSLPRSRIKSLQVTT